jgi:hypothetical protein
MVAAFHRRTTLNEGAFSLGKGRAERLDTLWCSQGRLLPRRVLMVGDRTVVAKAWEVDFQLLTTYGHFGDQSSSCTLFPDDAVVE